MLKNKTKTKPRGRPQVSTLKRLTKSVTVKFSKPDYEMLRRRSKNANCTLAEYIRDAAFDARIVAKHSTEDAAIIRNHYGYGQTTLINLLSCRIRRDSIGQRIS